MNPYYWLGYNLSRLLAYTLFRYRIIHREKMIQTGSVILAMNHQSFLDPPLGGIVCKRPIYFLARRSLLDVPVLGPILPKIHVIPVDQEGTDRRALKSLIHIVRAGNGALVFPEGSRTRDGQLHPGQPGIGLVIAKTLAPVVPMRIFGAYEAWPIGGKLRLHKITVVVGDPIHFTAADFEEGGRDVYTRASQRVMDAIAQLQIE